MQSIICEEAVPVEWRLIVDPRDLLVAIRVDEELEARDIGQILFVWGIDTI